MIIKTDSRSLGIQPAYKSCKYLGTTIPPFPCLAWLMNVCREWNEDKEAVKNLFANYLAFSHKR